MIPGSCDRLENSLKYQITNRKPAMSLRCLEGLYDLVVHVSPLPTPSLVSVIYSVFWGGSVSVNSRGETASIPVSQQTTNQPHSKTQLFTNNYISPPHRRLNEALIYSQLSQTEQSLLNTVTHLCAQPLLFCF